VECQPTYLAQTGRFRVVLDRLLLRFRTQIRIHLRTLGFILSPNGGATRGYSQSESETHPTPGPQPRGSWEVSLGSRAASRFVECDLIEVTTPEIRPDNIGGRRGP
jgi:hypothetical protein